MKDRFKALSKKMEYNFQNPSLIEQALTRESAIIEGFSRSTENYKRLAFVGDSVLELVIRLFLFETNPHRDNGSLTEVKSTLVHNSGPLVKVAKYLNLDQLLIVGRGEEAMGIRQNLRALSDAMEAIIGAMWLDSRMNFPLLKSFILKQWTYVDLLPEPNNLEMEIRNACYNYRLMQPTQKQEIFAILTQRMSTTTLDETLTRHVYDKEKLLPVILVRNPSQQALNQALIYAISEELLLPVQLLLEHNADPNTTYDNTTQTYNRWVCDNRDYLSALQLAVLLKSNPIVSLLLQYKAKPNWQGGYTFIQPRSEKDQILNVIHSAFDDEMPEMGYEDDTFAGLIPSRSVSYGHFILNHLLKPKPPKPIKKPNKQTALHIAVDRYEDKNDLQIIQDLLEAKADPSIQDHSGRTALHLLFKLRWNFRGSNLRQPLNTLLKYTHPNIVDVNENTVSYTLMHDAREHIDAYGIDNLFYFVIALLKSGADMLLKNKEGISAWEVGKNNGFIKFFYQRTIVSPQVINSYEIDRTQFSESWLTPYHLTWLLWEMLNTFIDQNQQIIGLVAAYVDEEKREPIYHSRAIEFGLMFFSNNHIFRAEEQKAVSPSGYCTNKRI